MLKSAPEKSAAEEKCLIFLHIPKAAGTTLYNIIERQFPPETIHDIYGNGLAGLRADYENFKSLPDEEREKIRLLRGHIAYGIHRHFRRPTTYITMLRHPVERIISHYYYVLRMPEHYLYQEVTSNKMSLADYVTSGITSELLNGQTRLLSGFQETGEVEVTEPSVATDVLDAARKNIREHFIGVGLAERFDESIILLKRLLGWSNVYYSRDNVTKGRPVKREIPAETIRLVENYNDADMELYEFANQVLEEKLREQGPSLKSELETFQKRNKFYSTAWQGYRATRRALHKVKANLGGSRND